MAEDKTPQNVAIPLKTAEVWTKNHRDNLELDGSKKTVNSYLITRETLEMVLKLGTTKVRAYIGLTDKNEQTLIFVGAKLEASTDTYRDVFGSELSASDAEESTVVYDFSEPSPPGKADESSPLN
jgi:hypothetical protein